MPRLGNEPLPTGEKDAQRFPTDVPRGTFIRGPSRTVRRADALAWMAERLFESGDAPALAPDRHEIVVHVEAEVLTDGRAGRCEIEHRTAIAAETARRLCCDAGIVPVVDGPNGEPLSVGRRTRSIPPAVRRALASRDGGCRFPGCPATHRLHGHHVKHWADGGETSLDNLILLCPTHHRLVHEGGFDVQRLDDGAFRFTNPHGLAIRPPRRRETSSPDTVVIQNESLGLAIDCETATAHWHGERLDYYAMHRMTNDRHVRLYANGEEEYLPAMEEGYVIPQGATVAEREAARDKHCGYNQAVEKLLEEKGFVMTDQAHVSARINRYLQTHPDAKHLR